MDLKITLLSLSDVRMHYRIDVIVRLDNCVPYSRRQFQFSDYDGSFPQKAKLIFVEKLELCLSPAKCLLCVNYVKEKISLWQTWQRLRKGQIPTVSIQVVHALNMRI